MFDYLKGIIVDKKKNSKGTFCSLEVNNVGYLVEIPERDFELISINENDIVKVYIHLQHKEDAMNLFGFIQKQTRDIFQILITVSGVGAKMALALLNEFDVCDLISLVINENYKELTKAKGVGPKLAQKIILELKDKLIKAELPINSKSELPVSSAVEDTKAILLSLGYDDEEINSAFKRISSDVLEKDNSEEILRSMLTILSI